MPPLPCGFLRVAALAVLLLAFCPLPSTAEGRAERAPGAASLLVIDNVFPEELDGNGDLAVDPGETWGVSLELANTGDTTLEGVTAVMTPQDSMITVLSNSVSFPPIPPTETQRNSSLLVFQLSLNATCGQTSIADFVCDAGDGSFVSQEFEVTPGLLLFADQVELSAAGLPVSIPDNDFVGATATVTYPAGTDTVTRLRVEVSVTHTWVSDLTLDLTSPSGLTVRLFNRHGSNGDNLTATVFEDSASTAISEGTPPYEGSFRPDEALSPFTGEPAAGTWTLKVVDVSGNDTGSLTDFRLTVFPRVVSCRAFARPTAPVLQPVLHYEFVPPSTVDAPGQVSYNFVWKSDGANPAQFDTLNAILSQFQGLEFVPGETWTLQTTPSFNGTPGDPATAKVKILPDGLEYQRELLP